jgi:hypothetical protein
LGRAACRRSASEPAPFFRGLLVERLALSGAAGPFAAASHLIDGCPSPLLGFGLVDASAPIAFFNMFRLPFLLLSVFRFVSARHDELLSLTKAD